MIAQNPSADSVPDPNLAPTQRRALEQLLQYSDLNPVILLHGDCGCGKSLLLERARQALGGRILTIKDFVEAMRTRDPFSIEETFYSVVMDAFAGNDVVLVDDLDLILTVVSGGCRQYPRSEYFEGPLKALTAYAGPANKRLIIATAYPGSTILNTRAFSTRIDDFKPDDYAALCRLFLGSHADRLDYPKIHRFAPKLSARQLKESCAWVVFKGTIQTEAFIDYLREMRMASNVHLGEVARVELSDLKGIDDILHALEANIIVPLENDALAQELGIKPKRGVLIAGPPGTGKTTIGRALAHRLRGKFFLIDGTFISGTHNFYMQVHQVFEAAKENSPAIIFIDDSDVIFESGEEHGLYRYLLTMLDGLESESNARVCVMMTAMDVGNLPPALIRSGRVELWLETRLPDREGRLQILTAALTELPEALRSVDISALADASEDLTGADLRRLVDDGKILYAYDRIRGGPAKTAMEYFLAATQTVRQNRDRYAKAEAQARLQRKNAGRPPWFDVHTSFIATHGQAPE